MQTNKLEVVQMLRGIAASMVVLMHFNEYIKPVAPATAHLLAHGYLGVDIFFVLSGFIIYVSTSNPGARSARGFILRRICRVVLPAWAAMTVLVLVKRPYLADLLHGLAFVPRINADPPFYGYSFLIVAWTLSYELVFYAAFCAVLLSDIGRRWRGLGASGLLIVLVFSLQALQGRLTLDAHSAPLFAGPAAGFPWVTISLLANPMLLEFAAGITLAWAYQTGVFARPAWQLRLFVAAILILLILLISFGRGEGHGLTRGGQIAVPIVVAALCLQELLVGGAERRAGEVRAWSVTAMGLVLLGEVSYSLYLIHPIVKAQLATSGASGLLNHWLGPWAQFTLAIAISLGSATLFYRWVELPAQRLGRRVSERSRQRVVSTC